MRLVVGFLLGVIVGGITICLIKGQERVIIRDADEKTGYVSDEKEEYL